MPVPPLSLEGAGHDSDSDGMAGHLHGDCKKAVLLLAGEAPSPSWELGATRSQASLLVVQGPRPGFSAALFLALHQGWLSWVWGLKPLTLTPRFLQFLPSDPLLFLSAFYHTSEIMLVLRRRALLYWDISFQWVTSGSTLPLLFIFRYQSDFPTLLYLPTGVFCSGRDPDVYNSGLRLILSVSGVQ